MCFTRLLAIIRKEVCQIKRDKLTLGMILGIPLMQLILFGLAINLNPKHLPTVLINADQSPKVRTLVSAIEMTRYFNFLSRSITMPEANKQLAEGKLQFIIQIPANFTRDLIRGDHPQILLVADATNPSAVGNAVNALSILSQKVFKSEPNISVSPSEFSVIVHNKYNPEINTQYNIVPGLLGIILTMTMTMAMVTELAITREREKGTMEALLATPVRPIEVIVGKIIPYIFVGYLQVFTILLFAIFAFDVPMNGSLLLLLILTLPFIAANLMVGITFSTIAQSQLQAMQMTFFFFLPSVLLSGFMFPFYGMPVWAQYIGNVLPVTHYLSIVKGIMIKGNGLSLLWGDIWALCIFVFVVGIIAIKRYRTYLS